jgi:Flp pilus assembly protein TadG
LTRGVRRQGGQAIVEFVLMANVMLVLLLALWQFGVVFANYIEVTDAARVAARKASSYGAPPTYDSTVENTSRSQAIASGMGATDVDGVAVTVTASPTWKAGSDVTATVTAPYTIDILGIVVSSGNLEHSTTMRIEQRAT